MLQQFEDAVAYLRIKLWRCEIYRLLGEHASREDFYVTVKHYSSICFLFSICEFWCILDGTLCAVMGKILLLKYLKYLA